MLKQEESVVLEVHFLLQFKMVKIITITTIILQVDYHCLAVKLPKRLLQISQLMSSSLSGGLKPLRI